MKSSRLKIRISITSLRPLWTYKKSKKRRRPKANS